MASLSELNKREREIRKALDDLKRGLEKNLISRSDYEAAKADNERQLKKIEEERKRLIGLPELPPAPPMPLPPAPEPPKRKEKEKKTKTEHKVPDSEMIKKAVLSSVPVKKAEKPKEKPPLPPKPESKQQIPHAKPIEVPKKTEKEKPKKEEKKPKEKPKPTPAPKKKTEIKKPKKKPLPKPKKIVKAVKKAEKSKRKTSVKPTSSTDDLKYFIKQQGKELQFTQKELQKLFDVALKNKERLMEMKLLKKEIDDLRKKIEGPDAKRIEEVVYSEFEKMNRVIEENAAKENNFMEQIKVEIDALRNEIEAIKKKETDIEKLDIPGLRRDIESLKEKSRWIEENIEKFDIQPLYEMIKDMENKLNVLKISSPLIID